MDNEFALYSQSVVLKKEILYLLLITYQKYGMHQASLKRSLLRDKSRTAVFMR